MLKYIILMALSLVGIYRDTRIIQLRLKGCSYVEALDIVHPPIME